MNDHEMYVTKRNGQLEIVSFDKILKRIKKAGQEVNLHKINYASLAMKVIDQIYDKITTNKIDELTAEQCASMSSVHPEYTILAGRIIISNHHSDTSNSFVDTMNALYHYRDKHDKSSPLVSEAFMAHLKQLGGKKVLDKICMYDRDYLIEYFGFKTLEKSYLMRVNGRVTERPQHMWLRVAIGIHGTNMAKVVETYDCLSQKYFTHATPTLFNAGTPHPQLSSCYLLSMESDSIDGIFNTLKDCALISKWAGGIGLHIHNVRATGSHIRGTNGASNGIVPMLKVFNNTAKYVDQCFHADTVVYTTEGPKRIQDLIARKTAIFNSLGGSETVQNVLEYDYSGDTLLVKTAYSVDAIQVTPEHPFYIFKDKNPPLSFANPYAAIDTTKFEWTEAKDIEVGHWLVCSAPSKPIIIDNPTITADDCYMYGILLAQYGPLDATNKPLTNITLSKKVADSVYNFIETYLRNLSIVYNKFDFSDKGEEFWNYQFPMPVPQFPFRISDFSNGIASSWLQLPLEKNKNIINGWLDARIDQLLHPSFYYSMHFLCFQTGIYSYIQEGTNKYILILSQEICTTLGIAYNAEKYYPVYQKHIWASSPESDSGSCIKYLLSPVTSVSPNTTYTGTVYDLQMAVQHDYLLHNGLVHNGGGKRNGSFAIYVEPWHADIVMFLQMRKNHGDEEMKARDLFYALWIPDLFMERVKANSTWTLMCPDECPGLSDVYGAEFVVLYEKYEAEKKGRVTISARDLWLQVLDAQMETGTPYLLYKDAANQKSNQKNIGTIKSSNLCTEIIEYSDETETAVCNLASIALPSCIMDSKTSLFEEKRPEEKRPEEKRPEEKRPEVQENPKKIFDFDKLHTITKIVTENLNRIIDINYYPTEKTKKSNFRHRPIGIGIQGLADVFLQLGWTFSGENSKKLNRDIFETIYHAALERSCELAEAEGVYETFPGSPASQGILQFDMWNIDPGSSRYDWSALKKKIQEKGLRNSLLLAPMPTASTSQILGYNECIEPITSNIYSRRTLAGEFILVNKYLMYDLLAIDMWNETIKNNMIANNGSIQHMETIPAEIREKYKTVWEIPMRHLIDMSADRGAFICQSQSLNLWLEDPNYNTLTSMHFYAWSKGLKTGIYYLRRRPKHQAQQFTIEPEKANSQNQRLRAGSEEICEMCSA